MYDIFIIVFLLKAKMDGNLENLNGVPIGGEVEIVADIIENPYVINKSK